MVIKRQRQVSLCLSSTETSVLPAMPCSPEKEAEPGSQWVPHHVCSLGQPCEPLALHALPKGWLLCWAWSVLNISFLPLPQVSWAHAEVQTQWPFLLLSGSPGIAACQACGCPHDILWERRVTEASWIRVSGSVENVPWFPLGRNRRSPRQAPRVTHCSASDGSATEPCVLPAFSAG